MVRFILMCGFAWVLLGATVNAQSISEYRYWWDDDLSTLTTTSVSTGQALDLATELSTTALGIGHHNLTIQVMDENGDWSIPYTTVFVQNGDMIGYEYWFDDDIASSTVQTTSESNLQEINTTIDVSSLSAGIHKISIRTLTNNGESSVPFTQFFKISGGDLVSWEYWFDDDVNSVIQESVSPPQSTLDLVDNLDASGLDDGPHTVTWRCEDATANWSVPITYSFDVVLGVEDIPGLKSIMVFPSPATNQLSLKVETNKHLQLNIDILNQQGQVINSYQNAISSMNNLLTMDVSKLAAGVYFLRLSSAEKATTHKFVKQ